MIHWSLACCEQSLAAGFLKHVHVACNTVSWGKVQHPETDLDGSEHEQEVSQVI